MNIESELTTIEKEIMITLIEGRGSAFITEFYDLTYKEYIKYKRQILKKLKIKRITQLTLIAIENNLI